jgi:hypothetical protein
VLLGLTQSGITCGNADDTPNPHFRPAKKLRPKAGAEEIRRLLMVYRKLHFVGPVSVSSVVGTNFAEFAVVCGNQMSRCSMPTSVPVWLTKYVTRVLRAASAKPLFFSVQMV